MSYQKGYPNFWVSGIVKETATGFMVYNQPVYNRQQNIENPDSEQ